MELFCLFMKENGKKIKYDHHIYMVQGDMSSMYYIVHCSLSVIMYCKYCSLFINIIIIEYCMASPLNVPGSSALYPSSSSSSNAHTVHFFMFYSHRSVQRYRPRRDQNNRSCHHRNTTVGGDMPELLLHELVNNIYNSIRLLSPLRPQNLLLLQS